MLKFRYTRIAKIICTWHRIVTYIYDASTFKVCSDVYHHPRISSTYESKIHIAWYSSVCRRRWSWGCTCHQLDGHEDEDTQLTFHSETKVNVNTYQVTFVCIYECININKVLTYTYTHLSCHPRQFSSFICNWCTFRGEKDNDKRHSTPPYDVIVDKTTLVHIICS